MTTTTATNPKRTPRPPKRHRSDPETEAAVAAIMRGERPASLIASLPVTEVDEWGFPLSPGPLPLPPRCPNATD
jgi:hypothetical protein